MTHKLKKFNKTWTMDPGQLSTISRFMIMNINWEEIDMIGSVDSSGIPFGISMSLSLGIYHVILPKQKKELKELVKLMKSRGEDPPRILIVDENTADDKNIINAVKTVLSAGASVEYAIVVVDYENDVDEQLAEYGIELKSVLKLTDFERD